jgi:hypothetical protein
MDERTGRFGWLDTDRLATELGLNSEQGSRLSLNIKKWDEKLQPALDGIRSCQILTAADYAVVVNVTS